MNKLTDKVLETVSENNNEYRTILRELNSTIDEKTSNLVSEIVTKTNYNLDFSNALNSAKEKVINPVSRIIESYIIKDLRSVETVNEQFVEKINDKIENTEENSEDKDTFINSLNTLLYDKYLEIVKIKRVAFFNQNNENDEIEEKILEFVDSLKDSIEIDMDILKLVEEYTKELYSLIEDVINKISNLYKENFINEVNKNINNVIDADNIIEEKSEEEFKPFIPEINLMPEIPAFDNSSDTVVDIPSIDDQKSEDALFDDNYKEKDENNDESLPMLKKSGDLLTITDESKQENEETELEVKPISPVEVEENDSAKHSYNVDEILKIAKSPILDMPAKTEKKDENFIDVKPIVSNVESDIAESEFDEEEIVKEMIKRLTHRLDEIKQRKEKYEEENEELEEDESFVNDLIESSKSKKLELDKFEKELDEKELKIKEKKKELEKKINDVMPFANALLNSEKES